MTRLEKGEQTPAGGQAGQAAVVDITWNPAGTPTGVFVCLLGATNRFLSKHHLLFTGQPTSPDGATRLAASAGGSRAHIQVQLALSSFDPEIHRVRFVLAVTQGSTLLSAVGDVELSAMDPTTGNVDATLTARGSETSRCLILADLFRDGDGWTIEAKGEEDTGSIADLANKIGVAV